MGKKGKKGKGVSGDAPVETGKDQAEGDKLGEASPPEKELGEKNLDDFLNDWDNDESDGDNEGGDSEGEESDWWKGKPEQNWLSKIRALNEQDGTSKQDWPSTPSISCS